MNTFVRFIYSLIVSAAVVAFVGFGVYAFYPGPEPAYEICYEDINYSSSVEQDENEYMKREEERQKCIDEQQNLQEAHAKNIAAIGLSSTALLAFGYMFIAKKDKLNSVLNDGLGLGVVGLGFYSIIWSLVGGPHRVLLFLSAIAFLLAAIVVGHTKFSDKK